MFLRTILYFCSLLFFSILAVAKEPEHRTPSEPIDITSEELRVFKNQHFAIFNGNVEATQGTLKLKCDKMTVYFEEKSTPSEPTEAEMEKSKINKIDFTGNVLITTPEETAKGDSGNYNVPQGIFTLEGDVQLTQKKNVLQGRKLIYNKNTGESLLTDGKTQSKQNRVRATLIPEEKSGKEIRN